MRSPLPVPVSRVGVGLLTCHSLPSVSVRHRASAGRAAHYEDSLLLGDASSVSSCLLAFDAIDRALRPARLVR